MANKKNVTVASLAKESSRDLDEVLILLWEYGIEYVNGPSDKIYSKHVKTAEKILGIPTKRELESLNYWQSLFKMGPGEFSNFLQELSINTSAQMTRLPKGAVKKLRKAAEKLNVRKVDIPAPVSSEETNEDSEIFEWKTVGKEREVKLLTLDEVRSIHWLLVEDFSQHSDPIEPPGVRSESLLNSAIYRMQTSIGSEMKYKSAEMVAAALLHSLVHDHPFHNGNKRTALVSTLVLLDKNGIMLHCDEDQLFKFVIKLAQHRIAKRDGNSFADREVLKIAEWILDNSRFIEKGERPIKFRIFRRILNGYGCVFGHGSHGSKINIEREVTERSKFGMMKKTKLRTQVYYGGEGRDVKRNTINKARADLHLDEDHGIDSASFYEDAPASVDDFISNYRKTLDRLARL
jgi:death-on-curing family protein